MRSSFRSPGSLFTMALAVLSVAVVPASLGAQDLSGRSRLEVRFGVGVRANSGTTVWGTGLETETKAAGLLGSIGYSRWLKEGLALTGSVGVLSAEAKTSAGTGGFEARAASIMLLFFGAKFYFPESTFGSQWRPYASVEVGPVIGSRSELRVGSVIAGEAITRTAVGSRIATGLDLCLGRSTMFGVSAGYDLMTSFSDAIGGQRNHSRWESGLSVGFLFGGSG